MVKMDTTTRAPKARHVSYHDAAFSNAFYATEFIASGIVGTAIGTWIAILGMVFFCMIIYGNKSRVPPLKYKLVSSTPAPPTPSR
uniref:Uncharacterized protein n=1 Tax=Panagrellus redivivus TaxID=6233 RepID=A0A7E4VT26_PANRE